MCSYDPESDLFVKGKEFLSMFNKVAEFTKEVLLENERLETEVRRLEDENDRLRSMESGDGGGEADVLGVVPHGESVHLPADSLVSSGGQVAVGAEPGEGSADLELAVTDVAEAELELGAEVALVVAGEKPAVLAGLGDEGAGEVGLDELEGAGVAVGPLEVEEVEPDDGLQGRGGEGVLKLH